MDRAITKFVLVLFILLVAYESIQFIILGKHLNERLDRIELQCISEIPLRSPEKLSKPFSFNKGTDTIM